MTSSLREWPGPGGTPEPQGDWVANWYITLTRLTDGETLASQFLPAEFETTLEVEYVKLKVPGLSHAPQQYVQTGNQGFDLELVYRTREADDAEWIAQARNFCQSLCYPRAGADSIITGAPSRVLVVWPNFLSLTCIVTKVQEKHSAFSREGFPVRSVFRLTLEEIRDVRLTAEDVDLLGLQRGSGSAQAYPETLEGWESLPVEGDPVMPEEESE